MIKKFPDAPGNEGVRPTAVGGVPSPKYVSDSLITAKEERATQSSKFDTITASRIAYRILNRLQDCERSSSLSTSTALWRHHTQTQRCSIVTLRDTYRLTLRTPSTQNIIKQKPKQCGIKGITTHKQDPWGTASPLGSCKARQASRGAIAHLLDRPFWAGKAQPAASQWQS